MQIAKSPLRVLSLDGGGVRGVLSARILSNAEALLNKRYGDNVSIGQRFNLIAGTSTGGIIALALALGRRASEVADFYEKTVPSIFGKPHKASAYKSICSPFYKSDRLRSALVDFFGEDCTLNDVVTDVCITAVSLQNAMPRFYKSGYLGRNAPRLDEKLVDVALATSAAPIYFPAHSLKHSANLVDGGLCANNPSMVALVEAIQFERVSGDTGEPADASKRQLEDIVLVSVGTGQQCAMPYDMDKLRDGGVKQWAARFDRNRDGYPFIAPDVPILEIILNSQSEVVHFQTKFLLGKNYLRINPQLRFAMGLDEVEKVEELKNLSDVTAADEAFLFEKLKPV
jgi:patatin-like phospholipase/acyl hydrolase